MACVWVNEVSIKRSFKWRTQRVRMATPSSLLMTVGAGLFFIFSFQNKPVLTVINRDERVDMLTLISSTIAGQGELFSSDFQACARSPRWATRCSFDSVSCSCNATPPSAILNRALPIARSPQSEQRRTWLVFAEQIKIFQVKAWLATFKAKNANLKLFRRS